MKVCKNKYKESKSKNLLEYFEKENLEPDYACREGFCGSCKLKLIEGEVEYHEEVIAFIDDDEFLPCISSPKNNLKVGKICN